ncbi:MAG TPA: SigE family RNA polymerase sigma factor [Solirubrobacteraceae bacterium]|jgi:RNA polymerase sigma-70 factor (sigma-E family)|nr:SigE family RNA polymerase sigma factor [Solirubrobacteraceae bacterium]
MERADASFDEFVTAHVHGLLNTAYLISCDESDAEDLVQECLLRVAKRWPRVRAMEMPAAYARRILVNLAIDGRRGQARRRRELGHSGHGDQEPDFGRSDRVDNQAEAAFELVADRAPLLDALRRLSSRQRAVIVLRYFEDLSEAETARLLGCGVGTVKASTARGLDRLRDIVEPQRTQSPGSASQIHSERAEP